MKWQKGVVKYFEAIRVILAVLIGFALALALLFFVSENPLEAIESFMLGPFENKRRFFNIIETMIPLTMTALGMCMMMQVGEFNLIGEGAFSLAGAFVTLFACKLLPPDIPPVIYPLILIVLGAAIGAVAALIPALLRIRWNANIVVVTIMLNYVLVLFSTYMLRNWMRDTQVTYLGSYKIAENAKLPVLLRGTDFHAGIFVVILAVVGIWWFLYKTTHGYEIRLTGSNRAFARYAGVGMVGAMLTAQLIGGALAGVGGTIEILGRYDRYLWMEQTGYGFDGLMIAVIARNNPALVPIAAFLMAYLKVGANVAGATTDVPMEFINVIQAIIIMLIAATMFFESLRKRAVVKLSMAEMGAK